MRPRTILIVVLLIVAPTGLLSLLAGWHVREREQLIDARIQTLGQNAVQAVARQVRQKLEDNLLDVRLAVGQVLNAGGGSPDISTAVARLRETHPAVTDVYVFMNPWGFLHPVIAGGSRGGAAEDGKAEDQSPTDALAAALRTRISAAPAWDEMLGVTAANHAFCFVKIEQRRGLYVGYRASPQETQRMVRKALMDFTGGGIVLSASGGWEAGGPRKQAQVLQQSDNFVASFVANFVDEARDKARDKGPAARGSQEQEVEPSGASGGGVVVYDSLSGLSREVGAADTPSDRPRAMGGRLPALPRSDRWANRDGGGSPAAAPDEREPGARLASLRLDPPLDAIVITATVANVGAMREAEVARINLLRWGIALLTLTVMAGLTVALREIAAELSRARARSEFVVGVSHDLRTPLASMKMLAESLLAGRISSPEKEKQFLGAIVQECDRLHQLVERVLYFVRFGQNALVFRRKPADAAELVRTAVEAFAARVGAEVRCQVSGVRCQDRGGDERLPAFLHFSISHSQPSSIPSFHHSILPSSHPPSLPAFQPFSLSAFQPFSLSAFQHFSILADAAAITQVILNLLDNAWKYSGGAQGEGVHCSVFGLQAPGPSFFPRRRSWVCIEVTDRGIGMSRREQRRLFRRFHRGTGALNANVSGVGLGLAMCRHIVRRHGGRITVRSEQGKGSTFTVWMRGAGGRGGETADLRPQTPD